jgi:hypothetical protein
MHAVFAFTLALAGAAATAAAGTSHVWTVTFAPSTELLAAVARKRDTACAGTVDGYTELRPTFLPTPVKSASSTSNKPDCYALDGDSIRIGYLVTDPTDQEVRTNEETAS